MKSLPLAFLFLGLAAGIAVRPVLQAAQSYRLVKTTAIVAAPAQTPSSPQGWQSASRLNQPAYRGTEYRGGITVR